MAISMVRWSALGLDDGYLEAIARRQHCSAWFHGQNAVEILVVNLL